MTNKKNHPNYKDKQITNAKHLEYWFLHTPIGREILRLERNFLHNCVKNIFGKYSIQLFLNNINFLNGNKIVNHYSNHKDLFINCDSLPFKDNSIDLIICPHLLEYQDNYLYLIQEMYRVLAPNGKVVITVFNKASWIGIRAKRIPALKSIHPLKLNTLKDDIAEVGFNIIGGKFFSYCPPFKNAATIKKYNWLNKVGDRWFPTLANSFALILQKKEIMPNNIQPKVTLLNLPTPQVVAPCRKN